MLIRERSVSSHRNDWLKIESLIWNSQMFVDALEVLSNRKWQLGELVVRNYPQKTVGKRWTLRAIHLCTSCNWKRTVRSRHRYIACPHNISGLGLIQSTTGPLAHYSL